MKTILLLPVLLVFFSFAASAQHLAFNHSGTLKQQSENPLAVVENDTPMHALAMFPGGSTDMVSYLKEHIKYPALARKKRIEGLVKVAFIVDQEGVISQVRVVEGTRSVCDYEVVQAIKSMPRWIPRFRNGQPVTSEVEVDIRYELTP